MSTLRYRNGCAALEWREAVRISHDQGQSRRPSKMVGGVSSHLELNPIPTGDAKRAQTVWTPGPKDPTETETELCSSISCGGTVSSGLSQGQGLWVQQTWVGISPPGEVTNNRTARTYTGLGDRLLGGHKQNLVHQHPGERSSDPTGDWPRLACECPGISSRGVGRQWPAAELGTLSAAVHAWDLLKEVVIIFTASTIVWPQVNSREGTQYQASIENWIKDLLSMAPPIRTRPSFPLSQSLPS